jgi:hypothetical protein
MGTTGSMAGDTRSGEAGRAPRSMVVAAPTAAIRAMWNTMLVRESFMKRAVFEKVK